MWTNINNTSTEIFLITEIGKPWDSLKVLLVILKYTIEFSRTGLSFVAYSRVALPAYYLLPLGYLKPKHKIVSISAERKWKKESSD